MKKKIVLLGLLLQASSSMFAQTANSRSDINSMLSSWLIPAIGLLMLGGFIGLVIYNQEALRGKNGLSKQDGWISVGEGMIFIVVGIAAIGIHSFETGKYEFQHLMDICKVYRGLDSPCKIKGVLSHYFYIVFCALSGELCLCPVFLSVRFCRRELYCPSLWRRSLNWEFRQLFMCISIGNPTK